MDSVDVCCCNCKHIVSPPIKQCNQKHTVCGKCAAQMANCPKCFALLYAVAYTELENIIAQLNSDKLNLPCKYENKGCTYKVQQSKKISHEAECRYRTFQCEGKKFCGWNCNWTGNFDQILSHFRHFHDGGMTNKVEGAVKIDFKVDTTSLEPIDYFDGQALFWYKHKVDVSKEVVYWLIQYVGLNKDAHQYYYEFDVFKEPLRKIKVIEVCEGDCNDANSCFESGKCVAIPFSAVRSFLNTKGYLTFRFRVMRMKKPSTGVNKTEEPISSENPVLYNRRPPPKKII